MRQNTKPSHQGRKTNNPLDRQPGETVRAYELRIDAYMAERGPSVTESSIILEEPVYRARSGRNPSPDTTHVVPSEAELAFLEAACIGHVPGNVKVATGLPVLENREEVRLAAYASECQPELGLPEPDDEDGYFDPRAEEALLIA